MVTHMGFQTYKGCAFLNSMREQLDRKNVKCACLLQLGI